MEISKVISMATMAGLVGLFVLNAQKATQLIEGVSKAVTSYVSVVQGR